MASTTVYNGVQITFFGHASIMLEGDSLTFYIDPFVLPKPAKPADVILYTHNHFDHCAAAPSITASKTITIGHKVKLPVRVIEIGQKEKIGGVMVECVDAYNLGKPFHKKGEGAGFIIRFKSCSVYIAGDTDFIPEMKGYKCDVAMVPIGGTFTMNPQEAADAIVAIMPKVAIPIHYNYLAETKANAEDFRAAVMGKAGNKIDVRILSAAVR